MSQTLTVLFATPANTPTAEKGQTTEITASESFFSTLERQVGTGKSSDQSVVITDNEFESINAPHTVLQSEVDKIAADTGNILPTNDLDEVATALVVSDLSMTPDVNRSTDTLLSDNELMVSERDSLTTSSGSVEVIINVPSDEEDIQIAAMTLNETPKQSVAKDLIASDVLRSFKRLTERTTLSTTGATPASSKQSVVSVEINQQQTLKNVMQEMITLSTERHKTSLMTEPSTLITTRSAEQSVLPSNPQQTLIAGATPTASRDTAVTSFDVQPRVNQPDWSRVVSSRVIFMAREGLQHAELRLNPANLGPVEVRLTIANEQTTVTFLASQSTTREALEQALPRLRESFAESGLSLGDAQVGEQSHFHQTAEDELREKFNSRQAQVLTELDDTEGAISPLSVSIDSEHSQGVSLYA